MLQLIKKYWGTFKLGNTPTEVKKKRTGVPIRMSGKVTINSKIGIKKQEVVNE